MSTTDMAKIYDVNIRTIQTWLKELGINRTCKEAQQIAVTKRDYKKIKKSSNQPELSKMIPAPISRTLSDNYTRYKINKVLAQELKDYEIIVGINGLGDIELEEDIPVVVIKDSNIYKFIIEVADNDSKQDEKVIKTKENIANNKGYKLFRITTEADEEKVIRDLAKLIIKEVRK
jgi:DNA-binding transcriptional regulator YhcF (GntR family)